jgi:hypothetical protein
MTEEPMDERPAIDPGAWHASVDLLDRFARIGLDPARAASVELHLLECERCRVRLAARSTTDDRMAEPLKAIWLDIVDAVDRPRVSPGHALLRRVGFGEATVRVVAATPTLRLSWVASIVIVLVFAVVAALTTTTDTILLVAAPLIPLAGIGAAYGAGVDPLHELVRAAPMAGSRIFLARALAVLATALPLTVAASLVLPVDRSTALAWLAPALGLVGLTMALSTWIEPRWAAGAAGAIWIGGLGVAWLRTVPLDGARLAVSLPFRPAGQIAFVLLAGAGALVFWRRQARFDDPLLQPVEVP